MQKLSANYIFPIISEPLKNSILILDDKGKVIDIIQKNQLDYEIQDVKYFEGILCPKFINAHCHLELSYLKNYKTKNNNIKGLNNFIISLEENKKKHFKTDVINKAIFEADSFMYNEGIAAVADICNSNLSFNIKKNSKLFYHNLIEIFGSDSSKAETTFNNAIQLYKLSSYNFPGSIVPHAPYSVSNSLFNLIKYFSESNNTPYSIHLLESEDEIDYFYNKSGKIQERIKLLNIDNHSFKPTGLSPLNSILQFLPKNNNILFVHNTYINKEDLDFASLNLPNLFFCFCPSSNLFIEEKLPDINLFDFNKQNICIGTDSLASNSSLSLIRELINISTYYSEISLHNLLKAATLNPAKYLGIDNKFGSFEKGKYPGVILLKNLNLTNLKLSDNSSVQLI